MPILIVEKMGPHFAIGDTCYSWEEDYPVFNPIDGKEIVARENEKSALRKTDIQNAYTNCHTDITMILYKFNTYLLSSLATFIKSASVVISDR